MRGLADLINMLAANPAAAHAFQIVAGAVLLFGGLIACLGAIGVMIVAAWRVVFGSVRKGRYYDCCLALIAGPSLALFWVRHLQATSELEQAIVFGWGYLPTILALLASDDLEKTGRALSRRYLLGYSGLAVLVCLAVALKAARAQDGNLLLTLVLIAGSALFGMAVAGLDARRKQAAAQPQPAPAPRPTAPAPNTSARRPASPPAAPRRPAYRPATPTLTGDFDLPPRE